MANFQDDVKPIELVKRAVQDAVAERNISSEELVALVNNSAKVGVSIGKGETANRFWLGMLAGFWACEFLRFALWMAFHQ